LGIADAVRRAYPSATFATWTRILDALPRGGGRVRAVGMLLVLLCMVPVVAGPRQTSRRRLIAAWLAACGALALVAHLSVLYRLQLWGGSVYLLAGAAGSFGLAGVFVGNRLVEYILAKIGKGQLVVGALLFLVFQLIFTLFVCLAAENMGVLLLLVWGSLVMMTLCFIAGLVLGGALPIALALSDEAPMENLPVFIFADAVGAAVAGLMFIALVPLIGLGQAAVCFAVLAFGLGICVLAAGQHARTAAAVAILCAMILLGRQIRDIRAAMPEPQETTLRAKPLPDDTPRPGSVLIGIPRRLDMPRIHEQMQKGSLSTNEALFWEK